jgi:hypothetical protein
MSEPNTSDKKKYWLDDKKNVDKIWWGVVVVTVLLCLADFLYHKHSAFAPGSTAAKVDEFWTFYGVYGFVACVGLVLAAKIVRKLLMRSENYYGASDE